MTRKKNLKKNYGPVSILPNLSKISEKIMSTQMTKFFKTVFPQKVQHTKMSLESLSTPAA